MVALPFNAHVGDVPIRRGTPAIPLTRRTALYTVMDYVRYVGREALQLGGKDTAGEAPEDRAPDKTATAEQRHAQAKDKKRVRPAREVVSLRRLASRPDALGCGSSLVGRRDNEGAVGVGGVGGTGVGAVVAISRHWRTVNAPSGRLYRLTFRGTCTALPACSCAEPP